jgi:hypothetical protein
MTSRAGLPAWRGDSAREAPGRERKNGDVDLDALAGFQVDVEFGDGDIGPQVNRADATEHARRRERAKTVTGSGRRPSPMLSRSRICQRTFPLAFVVPGPTHTEWPQSFTEITAGLRSAEGAEPGFDRLVSAVDHADAFLHPAGRDWTYLPVARARPARTSGWPDEAERREVARSGDMLNSENFILPT